MKPLNAIDEKSLLRRLREGDQVAFSTIYLKHHAPLCLFAGKLLGDEDEGQDIVDDVFLKLWEKKRQFNDSEHLKAFLYHSIRNACLDRLKANHRRAGRHRDYSDDYYLPQDDYLAAITRTEILTELFQAVSELPKQAERIIRKTYLEGKTNDEVAAEMNLSVQTVKNQKSRAVVLLRGKLSSKGLKILLSMTGIS